MAAVSHDALLADLRQRVANEEPLPGENFFQENQTLMRFLKAREWDVDAAEKQLREAIAWRRSYQPLTADCRWCHERPGCHSMRQVGFDESGRPVIYSCFAQADASHNGVEDSIAHCTYLIENAKRSMRPGVTNWIFVIDCTGLSLPQCSPSLAKAMAQVFGTYYPEQMHQVVCVNHSALFHAVWRAVKVFVDQNTVRKVKFVRGKERMQQKLEELFGKQLGAWLLEEIRLNKQEPIAESQEKFWEGPLRPGQHDPRGCPHYVEEFVDTYFMRQQQQEQLQLSKPHPSIAAQQTGNPPAYQPKAKRRAEAKKSKNEDQQLAEFGLKPLTAEEAATLEAGDDADSQSSASELTVA